jgi:putative FmdB family regulatory protein
MPLYEFECTECQERFEILVRNDDQQIRCAHCDSDKLQRVLNVFGSYSIKGNNSASQTPKRFRGGRPA